MDGERSAPLTSGARASCLTSVVALLLGGGCDCGSGEPGQVATEPESEIFVASSGAQTEEADRRWGEPAAAIEPLTQLPRLRWVGGNAPGEASLHPAQMLELEEPATGAALAAAYSVTYDAMNGMNGWFPLAETEDGWKAFVIQSDMGPLTSRRVACATDMRSAARIEDLVSVPNLVEGCRRLQAELGGTLGPAPDAEEIDARMEGLYAAIQNHASIGLRFRGPDGLRRADVHEVARALGMMRSDFGTYALYNEQDVGHDRLIVLDPGVHPDAPGGPDATTPDARITVDLATVPAPELVAERLWHAAEAMTAHLGVEPTWFEIGVSHDEPVTKALFDAEVRRRIAALRAAGIEADTVVAE